jgi:hypothetical protein
LFKNTIRLFLLSKINIIFLLLVLNNVNKNLLKNRMVLGKVASQVIDQCIMEINKHENIQAIKNKLLNPCFIHIYKYFHKYIILFYISIFCLCLSIIIILIIMIKVLNKLAILESKVTI